MTLSKSIVAVLVATVVLGALSSSAAATHLSVTSSRFKATWARIDFSGVFTPVECELTLEGSFHSATMSKVRESLIGFITDARVGSPCRRGSATVLRETLPWHLEYESFAGALPVIQAISGSVIGMAYRIREVGTFACLARSSSTNRTTLIFNREISAAFANVQIGGAIPCGGANGTLSGTSSTIDNGSGGRLTIWLI